MQITRTRAISELDVRVVIYDSFETVEKPKVARLRIVTLTLFIYYTTVRQSLYVSSGFPIIRHQRQERDRTKCRRGVTLAREGEKVPD